MERLLPGNDTGSYWFKWLWTWKVLSCHLLSCCSCHHTCAMLKKKSLKKWYEKNTGFNWSPAKIITWLFLLDIMSWQLGLQRQFCFPFPSSLLSERIKEILVQHPDSHPVPAISHPFPCPRDGISPLEAPQFHSRGYPTTLVAPEQLDGSLSRLDQRSSEGGTEGHPKSQLGNLTVPLTSPSIASARSQLWPLRTQKLSLCEAA